MSCQICFHPYDHSVHKPYTLSCLSHTFCICCIDKLTEKKCPVCIKPFDQKNPNLALLEFIPQSNYDKLKTKSLKILNELNEIKQYLNKAQDAKLTEYVEQIAEIKNNINNEANVIIELVKSSQEKLIKEASSIELDLRKCLSFENIISIKSLDTKMYHSKLSIETNKYSEEQLVQFCTDTFNDKINLNRCCNIVDKFKEDLKFNLNQNSIEFGEIKTNKKVIYTHI